MCQMTDLLRYFQHIWLYCAFKKL